MSLTESLLFAELYETHIRRIYAYCLRRSDSSADAQDAAAEIFTVVWRRWADLPPGDDGLPWIYGIARNVLANRKRSIRRQARLAARLIGLRRQSETGPEGAAELRSECEHLRIALTKLSQKEQETLRLVEWEGLTRDDVAGIYGVSRSAIDQRISRAYRHLEHLMDRTSVTSTAVAASRGNR